MKIYYASPLFSDMERMYNDWLTKEIYKTFPSIEMYVPQNQDDINDKTQYANSVMIAKVDTDQLLSSQLVVAVLDGPVIDVGVATEIGVAYGANIPVIGLYTDSRQQGATVQAKLDALQEVGESQFSYINLYTIGLIKTNGQVVNSTESLLAAIATYMASEGHHDE